MCTRSGMDHAGRDGASGAMRSVPARPRVPEEDTMKLGISGAGASHRVTPAVPRQGLDGSGALRLTRPWTVCHRRKRRSRRLPAPMTSQVIAGTPLGTHTQSR